MSIRMSDPTPELERLWADFPYLRPADVSALEEALAESAFAIGGRVSRDGWDASNYAVGDEPRSEQETLLLGRESRRHVPILSAYW
jgi:hypothetical protein